MLVMIIAIAASSGKEVVTPTGGGNVNTNNNLNTNQTPSPLTMGLPVINATVSKTFSDNVLQYNETLKQYEAHLGVDFVAAAGSKVYSVLDGTVTEVGNSYLKGNYVVISHNNGLKSVYSSLDENISVAKGDKVDKGDIVGVVGSSAYSELEEGNHLHFELLDNDKKIDPSAYLDIANK
jgi:murein DD-endopeptidase MepM/ murein hydrolase activator NlpD